MLNAHCLQKIAIIKQNTEYMEKLIFTLALTVILKKIEPIDKKTN